MPKIVINDSQGLVQERGSGVEISSTVSMASLPTSPVSNFTAATTVVAPGVYTLSASQGVLTTTMPLASAVPGGLFVFRTTSPSAHVLTGSQEVNGTQVFAGHVGATPANAGSAITFPAVVGSSVALISDGKSYLFAAASGSFTISGT